MEDIIRNCRKPILYLFAGLPGTGKSALGRRLAGKKRAVYLRIDTVEQGLRDLCCWEVRGEGYRLAYRVAADNLQNGIDVVADSCNPLELTRSEWESVALANNALSLNIEILCSDPGEHQTRIENRIPEISGLRLPTWKEVQEREYHDWTRKRIVIDTAGRTIEECLDELLEKIDPFLQSKD